MWLFIPLDNRNFWSMGKPVILTPFTWATGHISSALFLLFKSSYTARFPDFTASLRGTKKQRCASASCCPILTSGSADQGLNPSSQSIHFFWEEGGLYPKPEASLSLPAILLETSDANTGPSAFPPPGLWHLSGLACTQQFFSNSVPGFSF